MKVRRAYALERAIHKRMEQNLASEEAAEEAYLASLEATDPIKGRLALARSQGAHARLAFWGLPSQAILWAGQAIDNSIHAALLILGPKKVSRNHAKKVEAFLDAYPEAMDKWQDGQLSVAQKTWQAVRYERVGVSRLTSQRLVDLSDDVYDFSHKEVARVLGIKTEELDGELEQMADSAGLPLTAHSESAMEKIDAHNWRLESSLQSSGLSEIAAQLAHGGHDIHINLTANKAWVRALLSQDPDIAEQIKDVYKGVFQLTNSLIERRLIEMVSRNPDFVSDPARVVEASDFELAVSLDYVGHSLLKRIRRVFTGLDMKR